MAPRLLIPPAEVDSDPVPQLVAANIWKVFAKPPCFSCCVICALAVAPGTKIRLDATLSLDSLADLSDLFRNRIAALSTTTGSCENTNSKPDTDPSGKGQDVTHGMVLAPNFSSQ